MTNHCGECTLCCRLLGIKEIAKPQGKWCPNCAIGKGCKIYDTKPPSCSEYACIWLASQEAPNPLPVEYRPDKSKVVLSDGDDAISVQVDPARPLAWREERIYKLLQVLATQKRVIISVGVGNDKIMMQSSSINNVVTQRKIRLSDPDADGVQHYYPELNHGREL